MGKSLVLEDFSGHDPFGSGGGPGGVIDEGAMLANTGEEDRSKNFEEGYLAGWNDANSKLESTKQRISEELSRNLSNLNFTYFEAREELLQGMEQFAASLFSTLFPAFLPMSVSANLVDEICKSAGEFSDAEIKLTVSHEDYDVVLDLVQSISDLEVSVEKDTILTSGQAIIRSSRAESLIDLSNITDVLNGAFESLKGQKPVASNRAVA